MIQIHAEAEEVASGRQPRDNNVLKNAPHSPFVIALSEAEWNRSVCPVFLALFIEHSA